MSFHGVVITDTTDKSIRMETKKDMADSNAFMVFMKATGATMAPYAMGEAFMVTLTSWVP